MITDGRKAYIRSVLCSFTDEEIEWYLNETSTDYPATRVDLDGNGTRISYVVHQADEGEGE